MTPDRDNSASNGDACSNGHTNHVGENGTPLPPLPLLPQHHTDLRKSGISDEWIRRARLYSIDDQTRVAKHLNRRKDHDFGCCLCIPFYFGPDQEKTDYSRLKPDRPRPRKGKAGEVNKYESPCGSPNRAYHPPGIFDALKNAQTPIILTEGEKKTLKACQEGFPCLGLVGVWGWSRKREKGPDGKKIGDMQLIDDLQRIDWTGRQVFIVFDSDANEKADVRLAEFKLSEVLQRHGAIPLVVRLPPGPTGRDGRPTKQGLDDYLCAHTADEFRQLLTNAAPAKKPTSVIESLNDPHRLARLYLLAHADHAEGPLLRYYRGEWHRWNGRAYRAEPEEELRGHVTRFCNEQFERDNLDAQQRCSGEDSPPEKLKVTTGLIGNVLQALLGELGLSQSNNAPFWLDGTQSTNFVSVRNGLLDIDAFLADKPDLLRHHTPLWFSPATFDFAFDLRAQCPKWMKFLERNLEGDLIRIGLLQRWFGYCLLFDATRQKFLLMLGEGKNGKSVACAALTALLGSDNTSSVPLELFGQRFHLSGTLGKLANIVAEVGELDKVCEAALKAFVNGDGMTFEEKFKKPFKTRPTARLVLATNNSPEFRDKSDGIWRRILCLKFNVQITEEERVVGMDTPEWWIKSGELPGILNWALAGLALLRREQVFVMTAEQEAAVDELRRAANPARRFLLEYYEPGDGTVEKGALYQHYGNWCHQNGYMALSEGKLAAEVYRTFKTVQAKRMGAKKEQRREQVYAGLVGPLE